MNKSQSANKNTPEALKQGETNIKNSSLESEELKGKTNKDFKGITEEWGSYHTAGLQKKRLKSLELSILGERDYNSLLGLQ